VTLPRKKEGKQRKGQKMGQVEEDRVNPKEILSLHPKK
jgi:hypothetical protein